MKKLRIHFCLIIALFILTFILGSFFDLQISKGIGDSSNKFALTMSIVGTYPGDGLLAFVAGGFFLCGLRKDYEIKAKIGLFFLSILCLGIGTYFFGKEFFGPNGFTSEKNYKYGFLISFPIMVATAYLGYLFFKNKADNKQLWIILLIFALSMGVAMVVTVEPIKYLMRRPRYRSLNPDLGLEFHNWWERCKDYSTYMKALGLGKDEFKSFPSGHTANCAITMLAGAFIPLVNKKYEKYQLPLLYAGLVWAMFIAFTRILAGAHFLSDVSFGGLISIVTILVANEVVIYLRRKEILHQ